MSQFQLFPPPPVENNVSTNPFRRGKKKQSTTTQPPSPIPLEELKNSNRTEAVLFQIIEDTGRIQPPPKAHIFRSQSPIHRSGASPKPKEAPRSSSRQSDRPKRQASSASAGTGSTTLVNSTRSIVSPTSQDASPESDSQGAPINSIFPRYNFSLPLNQQKYYPQSSNDSPRTRVRPEGLTLSPPPPVDQALGPKTVPASVMEFPTGVLDTPEIRYSTLTELKDLWEAANGQRPQDLTGSFNLRMIRTEPATFTFGESQHPFYTLNTYSTNELSISRTDPSKQSTNIPIMMLSLEDRGRRNPPNDGLISLIFSRLAAMLAIDQAQELKKRHLLSTTEANEVESDALHRAAAQESYRLSWNHSQRIYELQHASPSTQDPRPALVGTAGIALSPVQKKHPGTLHITVSGDNNNKPSLQPPTILVTTPILSNSVEGASRAPSPRTSTLPLTDSDEPLASLDLATMTLSISAAAIISTIPSLYAIDTLVAAILAVAVSDEATNPVLADMALNHHPTIPPQPKHPQYHPSPFNGKLIATLAEREDALQGEELISHITNSFPSSSNSNSKPTRKSLFRFWSNPTNQNPNPNPNPNTKAKSKSKSKNKNKKIIIEEFDLERYGRYSASSSREGQKLPVVVRGVLRVMFFILDLVVRGLTMVVRVLAWVVVNLTRCVTSERF